MSLSTPLILRFVHLLKTISESGLECGIGPVEHGGGAVEESERRFIPESASVKENPNEHNRFREQQRAGAE
jgi:hypothetical protein